MIEIGVFHNGASDLPTISTPDEVEVNDGTLAEVHESSQRVLLEQIRQGILADLYDISKRVSGETLLKKGVALAGRPADVAEEIIKIKKGCGYEDYIVNAWFETGGLEGREIEDQMQCFAEEVSPLLKRACGGQVQNPPVAVNLEPTNGSPSNDGARHDLHIVQASIARIAKSADPR